MPEQVTNEQMRYFLGSDIDYDGLIDELCNIANGNYSSESLREDTLEHFKEKEA